MTTVGTSTWGIALSSAQSSGPSGDICYFFCNDYSDELDIKDKPSHAANQISYAVVLKQMFYSCKMNDCIVADNTVSKLNEYRGLLKNWVEQTTSIYLHVKDAAGTYLHFDINGTESDYLKCRIVGKINTKLKNSKKTLSISVEECS